MERHVYTVSSPQDFNRCAQQLKIPRRAKISFWYEVEEQEQAKENWKDKLRSVAGIWEDYDNAQEDLLEIKKSTK